MMKILRLIWLVSAVAGMSRGALAQDVVPAIGEIEHRWVKIYYQTSESQQESLFPGLAAEAAALTKQYPASAEPLVWQAIVLGSYARVKHGLGALDLAKKARDSALAAVAIDGRALDAGAYTALGALYYKVPGWPIGFGNDATAKEYLDKALAIAPTAIDVNYFYGDFMIEQGDKKRAREFLEKALHAPLRPGHEEADAGRRKEIQGDLAKLQTKLQN